MNDQPHPTDLNNTPDIIERPAADAPMDRIDRRGSAFSARGIVYEWWWMRITAGLLVPLSVWFLVSLVTHLLGAEPFVLVLWLRNPFVASAMVVMLAISFIHTQLGLHEIITDYAHGGTKKMLAFIADAASLGLAIAAIVAVVTLHRAA